MQFLFNLAVIASLVYVLFGATPFERGFEKLNAESASHLPEAVQAIDVDSVEARVDQLMKAVKTELQVAGAPEKGIESVVETGDGEATAVPVAAQPAFQERPKIPEPAASSDVVEVVMSPKLISLADRAYALDRLLIELETDVARR